MVADGDGCRDDHRVMAVCFAAVCGHRWVFCAVRMAADSKTGGLITCAVARRGSRL